MTYNYKNFFIAFIIGLIAGTLFFAVENIQASTRLEVEVTVCGNGILDTGEQCDGINLGGQTCQGLGFSSGVLNCKADCTFDTSSCVSGGGGGFIPPTPPQVVLDPSLDNPEIPKSLTINNNNNYTDSLGIILNLSAENAFQMAISNSLDFNSISWENYNISKNWILTEGEGKKTVYAKFRSRSGGVSEIVSDTIIFDITAPTNVSFLKAEPGDKKTKLSWINPKNSDFAGVKINHSQESYSLNPDEGEIVYEDSGDFFIDTNLENKITYFYTVFSYDQAGNYSSGAIIFAIPQSSPISEISPETPAVPEKTIPEIPPEIIPLIPQPPQPPIIPPLPPKEKTKLPDFSFQIKTDLGSIEIPREKLDKIKILKEMPLNISIPSDKFIKEIKAITASITNGFSSSYLLKLNNRTNAFETTIPAPFKKGKYNLLLNIIYQDGTIDSISTEILIDPYGYIYEKIKNQELRITNVKVSLFYLNPKTKKYELWPAEKYKQKNPQITDNTGEYAFMVPKGKYYLEITKENYYSQKTDEFEVVDEVVNLNVEMKKGFLKGLDWKRVVIIVFGILFVTIAFLLFNFKKGRKKDAI